ncbi:hypothetical protein EI94DRAFT_1828625, partial [Lactarius quietus]
MPSSTRNATAVDIDFSRTMSSDSADLNDGELVDLMPIPHTLLEPSPPAFPPPSLIIGKGKSPSRTKSRKRKEHRAHVPFPSSTVEGASENRPRRIPQMTTARGRDGGRTQSGSVKDAIVLSPGRLSL